MQFRCRQKFALSEMPGKMGSRRPTHCPLSVRERKAKEAEKLVHRFTGIRTPRPFLAKIAGATWIPRDPPRPLWGAWGGRKRMLTARQPTTVCVVSCVVTLASLPVLGCVEGCHSGIGERQRTAAKAA